jgi:hypothetical protein
VKNLGILVFVLFAHHGARSCGSQKGGTGLALEANVFLVRVPAVVCRSVSLQNEDAEAQLTCIERGTQNDVGMSRGYTTDDTKGAPVRFTTGSQCHFSFSVAVRSG